MEIFAFEMMRLFQSMLIALGRYYWVIQALAADSCHLINKEGAKILHKTEGKGKSPGEAHRCNKTMTTAKELFSV